MPNPVAIDIPSAEEEIIFGLVEDASHKIGKDFLPLYQESSPDGQATQGPWLF